MGNATNVFDAVDLENYFFHGEVPGVVYDFREFDFGDGDMPGLYGGGVLVDGEELHIDGVCIIWGC